jgi:ABC-type polysaccharide/polyol phosphate export permease
VLGNLRNLFRYRVLIQSLVVRELKARYRGSLLGFFWSFINPLLLLLVYTFVFATVMPRAADDPIQPYALFMFCGILPWAWFSSSLLEASNVLIAGGNLIKKVLFPAEVLPIVTVLAGLGWRRWPPALAKASVVYAVALNTFALVAVTKLLSQR